MSVDEIKRFQADAQSNKDLQKEILDAGNDIDAIAACAAKNGYSFTADELKSAIAAKSGSELGDDDLEKVAGGAVVNVVASAAI